MDAVVEVDHKQVARHRFFSPSQRHFRSSHSAFLTLDLFLKRVSSFNNPFVSASHMLGKLDHASKQSIPEAEARFCPVGF